MTEHISLTGRPAIRRGVSPPEPSIRFTARRERLRRRLARRIAGWAGLLLCGYWIAAFALTHLPMKGGGRPFLDIPHADKLAHLAIYTGLSGLLSVWFGVRQRIGGAFGVAVVVLVSLTAYATFDELTQIPVGRHADLFDWFADLAGILLGLCGFFALRAWVRRT